MTVRSTTIFTIFWGTLLEFQKVHIPIYKKLLIWGVSFFFNQTKFQNPAFWFVSRSGIKKQIDCFTEKCKRRQLSLLLETIFNRRWHISTTPNTAKKLCALFKLIQHSNMVTLSCLSKKNQNLKLRKKKVQFIIENGEVCGMKNQLPVINWTLFSRV